MSKLLTARRVVDESVQFIPPKLAMLALDMELRGVRFDYFATPGARIAVKA